MGTVVTITVVCSIFAFCIIIPVVIVEYILQQNYRKFKILVGKLWNNALDDREYNKCDEYKDLYIKGALRYIEHKGCIDNIKWFKNKCKELENENKHDI